MTTAKTMTPASTIPVRSGFQPIPTRIRDVRDVPPLVVEPVNEAIKAEVGGNLQELGIKLAGVHRAAAEAWLSQAAYDKALPHLEAAATFAPAELEYHNQIGFVRYITGDDTGAITAFNTVLATDPINAEAWFNLGMVLFGQEQFAEAEDCFRRSIENRANDAQAWNNRGVCLFQIGRGGDAKTCFENALKIDPNDADARFNLTNLR
jgi:Flp pilus assembly protein TadD